MGKAIATATRAIVRESEERAIKLEKCKDLLERAAEELQDCYGRDIDLTLKIHELLEDIQ